MCSCWEITICWICHYRNSEHNLYKIVSIISCCITNYPWPLWLLAAFIISVSVGQEARCCLSGSNGFGCHNSYLQGSWKQQSFQGLLEKEPLQAHSCGCWQDSGFCTLLAKVLLCLLAMWIFSQETHNSQHGCLHQSKQTKRWAREREGEMEHNGNHNLL